LWRQDIHVIVAAATSRSDGLPHARRSRKCVEARVEAPEHDEQRHEERREEATKRRT
jgi:hypothetical protein